MRTAHAGGGTGTTYGQLDSTVLGHHSESLASAKTVQINSKGTRLRLLGGHLDREMLVSLLGAPPGALPRVAQGDPGLPYEPTPSLENVA